MRQIILPKHEKDPTDGRVFSYEIISFMASVIYRSP